MSSSRRQDEAEESSSSVGQPLDRSSSRSVETSGSRPRLLSSQHPSSDFRGREASDSSSAAKAPKIAIPRLPQRKESGTGITKASSRHRILHACEPCRTRKTKCSGDKPSCKHCLDFGVRCVYADGKRDRAKKAFGSLNEKVAGYEVFLNELTGRVSEDDAKSIRALLNEGASGGSINSPGAVDGVSWAETESESGAESEGYASAGSTGAADRIDEDFNRSEESRTTGFMGKNSEISWLQSLRAETRAGSSRGVGVDTQTDVPMHEASYHLDDFALTSSELVDPYQFPAPKQADELFNAYLESVHPSFPIIGKSTFSAQYRKFSEGSARSPGERWLAILHMIFAIGARYSHLIQAEWRGQEEDHLTYFSRARMLGLNSDTIFDHPDLQQVQVTGLIAFYLMATSQINRAWTISGLAVRAAGALGLNLRNDASHTPDISKEIRYRVWWSIYTTEHQLSLMTGRAGSVSIATFTAPLPVPVEEDRFQSSMAVSMLSSEMQKTARYPGLKKQRSAHESASSAASSSERSHSASKPTSASRSPAALGPPPPSDAEWARNAPPSAASYFLYYTQLAQISQSVLERIYSPDAMRGTWSDIQASVGHFNEMTTRWHRNLPATFDFKRNLRDQVHVQHRMALGFCFYGTRIIANRPCLCRLDRKIPNQSSRSQEFNRKSAAHCVNAGREMLQMLPDEPNGVGLNRIGPWWRVVHSLVQATVVLLLELAFRVEHMPEAADSIFEASRKGVRWLHSLGENNPSARRAWRKCNVMFIESARLVGREVQEVHANASDPSHFHQSHQPPVDFRDGLQDGEPIQPPSQSAPAPSMDQNFFDVSVYTGFDEYSAHSLARPAPSYFPNTSDLEFSDDAWGLRDGHDEYQEQQ